ncbi:FimB/Mfa2 family fimbrial subunit [Parabacteroides sp. OttesenSCG-928-K15]|nr:FimB/Mfa2 family fimbrial subunit [Parabacteroides sp. OttesenSCG-928-K15]
MITGFALIFSSCQLENEVPVCNYNIQLEYWSAENTVQNELPMYVRKIDEYIFDNKGVLFMINRIDKDRCTRQLRAEYTLPPGNYSVVSWGNCDSVSRVSEATPGVTTLSEMQLRQERKPGQESHPMSEDIYYGFRTFSVPETGVGRTRVVMSHAYLLLDITIRWKSKTPDNTKNFSITFEQTHDRYPFLPHYMVRSGYVWPFDLTDEEYNERDISHRYYLMNRHPGAKVVNQRKEVTMDITRSISARFTAYRISNNSHPILRLYAGDQPLMKEIDLYKFFSQMGIELDMNLRQEFFLLIEIDGDKVTVMPMIFSDWINGGEIGGQI